MAHRAIREKQSQYIKQKAAEHGFDFCGIAKAEKLVEEEENLTSWLSMGFHGKMEYMERHFDKRLDPTKLVPGAKSVISLLYNYYPDETIDSADGISRYRVAKYAYGKDYRELSGQFDRIELDRSRGLNPCSQTSVNNLEL